MPPADDPWDLWRRRYGADFPSFMAEFEKEFARMQGMVNRIMEDAMKHAQSPQRGEPFVYGFTMRVDKDGNPQITPFGNSGKQAPVIEGQLEGQPEARQPLVDVVEADKEISVTVELPGVEKGDVNLHVAEDSVTVKVEKGRRYRSQVALPAKVVPNTAKATFKNGILDVTIQRKSERKDPGQRVQID